MQLDSKQETKPQFAEMLFGAGWLCIQPFGELYRGILTKQFPWSECLFCVTAISAAITLHVDYQAFERYGIAYFYPATPKFYWPYFGFLNFLPFWFWGVVQVGRKRHLLRRLTELFRNCCLVTPLGGLPAFVFDRPTDEMNRKLRLSKRMIPFENFQKAKSFFQSALNIYVDEVRDNLETGTVDYIYSFTKMASEVRIADLAAFPKFKFLVGRTRSRDITANLADVPHLLVAGQTGGGKSTFLRQFITVMYLNNKTAQFTLIDLKGGLEFQLFDDTKRIKVIPDVERAIKSLEEVGDILKERMALLRSKRCKDLDTYLRTHGSDAMPLDRHILVVDEAAEMFLAGAHAKSGDILTARRILSQVARQGRSVGVHLVVATQRPDSKSLDPQVKANLTGIVCFQMQNDSSSILVLGTGRATDLPAIPGRAIWKCGLEAVEIQTPLVDAKDVDEVLKPHRRVTFVDSEQQHEAQSVVTNE